MPEMDNMVTKQLYLPDTNVLVTRFFAEEGIAEVIDFMPIQKNNLSCTIIRRIATIRGRINYKMHCSPRFNYAASGHTIVQAEDAFVFTPEKGNQPPLMLYGDCPFTIESQDVTSSFTLTEGQHACVVLDANDGKVPIKEKPK